MCCCAWQSQIFGRKFSCPKNGENRPKIGYFMNLLENVVIGFFWIRSIKKVYINCCILAQIPYLRKSGSWDMGQNPCGQSDCRIFKSTLSPQESDQKAWLFSCRHRIMEIKKWSKNIGVGVVKNGCVHSGLRALKSAYLKKDLIE